MFDTKRSISVQVLIIDVTGCQSSRSFPTLELFFLVSSWPYEPADGLRLTGFSLEYFIIPWLRHFHHCTSFFYEVAVCSPAIIALTFITPKDRQTNIACTCLIT